MPSRDAPVGVALSRMPGGVPSLTILGARQFLREDVSGPNIVKGGPSRAMPFRSIGIFKPEGPRRNAPLRALDGRVSRAAAEARSNSAMGGVAAAPTSGVENRNRAPRNRSAAEIPRSRRDWASGCVSPTGARRDRPSGRPDEWREENAARGPESARSNIGRGVRRCPDVARRRADLSGRSLKGEA